MATELKDVSIQKIVDLIGNYIVKDNIPNSKVVTKSFGEVEIKATRYQIQISLVPGEANFNTENGVVSTKIKKSFVTKFINLFKNKKDDSKPKL